MKLIHPNYMNIELKSLGKLGLILGLLVFFFLNSQVSSGAVRLKDVATVKGVRENILIGYGIIVGLNGTGDSSTDVTSQSLGRLFKKLGLNIDQETAVQSKNAAAVIATAKLPPFARVGSRIDVTISSIGDAKSVEGGILLVTPLRGGDQNVYAVAQGPVSIGSVSGGDGTFPTVGRIVSGATIEKDLDTNFAAKKSFRLSLKNPDFTTAARIVTLINGEFGGKFSHARDSGTIDVVVPFNYQDKSVEMMAILENIKVNLDSKAKVVLNERTGTVVMGGKISIGPVAISHGELSIEVEDPPAPRAPAGQAAGGGGDQEKKEEYIFPIQETTNVSDLVKVLNKLGVRPKDLTAIFQTLRRVGALQADLEIM